MDIQGARGGDWGGVSKIVVPWVKRKYRDGRSSFFRSNDIDVVVVVDNNV